jgi:hypothetical protein
VSVGQRVIRRYVLAEGSSLASEGYRKQVEASRHTSAPPGTHAPTEFASNSRIDRHPELKADFIHRVLDLPWHFYQTNQVLALFIGTRAMTSSSEKSVQFTESLFPTLPAAIWRRFSRGSQRSRSHNVQALRLPPSQKAITARVQFPLS